MCISKTKYIDKPGLLQCENIV